MLWTKKLYLGFWPFKSRLPKKCCLKTKVQMLPTYSQSPQLAQNFVYFFKYSPNFSSHALKSELNKVWYASFIEFKYDRSNPFDEWAIIEKIKKQCFFYLHFAVSNCKVIFFTLYLEHQKDIISYLECTQNLCTTPQKKFNHRIPSSRAKTRSTQRQTCMKVRVYYYFY